MTFDDAGHDHDYFFSTDKKLMNISWIENELLGAPWGDWYTREIITSAINGSLCAGVYRHDTGKPDWQVGFARVVSDHSTFHYICDVIIQEQHRSKGLGRFLVQNILALPQLKSGVCLLRSNTAEAFYEKLGFREVKAMRRIPNKCT